MKIKSKRLNSKEKKESNYISKSSNEKKPFPGLIKTNKRNNDKRERK